jgi:octaprenyl-diphosphate synthase
VTISARLRTPVAAALIEIQTPVREQLDNVPTEMWRIVKADAPIIAAVNAHLMGMKGKMLRPTLLLLSSALEERSAPNAQCFAAVAELVHLASVVHDDSVDHSNVRRGQPTVNALFSHQIAVIMGDYLYSRALAELVRLENLEPLRAFTSASNAMTLGEMRQLSSYDALNFSERDYFALNSAKTASLLGASCEVGALCGAPRHRAALRKYGELLGMAFQVADDLLDYTETESVTGKPSGNDLREHKVTLPLIAALKKPSMSAAARGVVDALFDTAVPTDAQIAEVVGIVTENGGLDYARQKGEEFAQEAEEALAGVPASEARQSLADAIAYVLDRRS